MKRHTTNTGPPSRVFLFLLAVLLLTSCGSGLQRPVGDEGFAPQSPADVVANDIGCKPTLATTAKDLTWTEALAPPSYLTEGSYALNDDQSMALVAVNNPTGPNGEPSPANVEDEVRSVHNPGTAQAVLYATVMVAPKEGIGVRSDAHIYN